MSIEPHEHKALTDVYYAAPKCWDVYCLDENNNWVLETPHVSWDYVTQYKLEPSPLHPSYEKWKIYTANPEWWVVYENISLNAAGYHCVHVTNCDWRVDCAYELRKSPQHPDNGKPKKKLIDWSKIPKGTMTNCGEIRHCNLSWAYVEYFAGVSFIQKDIAFSELRLAEQTRVTPWSGGECPVPEGVAVEVVFRNGKKCKRLASALRWWLAVGCDEPTDVDIISYRITGIAEGWTDVPEEAV